MASRAKLNVLRGLRFRLTITNSVFLIGLLIAIGFFFRGVLSRILDNQVRDVLQEEWAAAKGYLVIHKRQPNWKPDPEDPEETFIVQRLQRVFLLADAKGKVIDVSPIYEDLGVQPPTEIVRALASNQEFWQDKRSSDGELYRLRGGTFIDDDQQTYFVVIGRSMQSNENVLAEFTRDYLMLLPGLIISGILLGWIVAGRAISPVNALARTAESISGTNLGLRIPLRHTGDELDHLIKTFNSMVERLERSFQMTRQFSTDVSHELRTPLTAIRGQLEVALLTAKSPDQYREAMINALEDVERLTRTIRAMLLLSQAESGQLALQKSTIDLSALVEDIVDQFQIPAEEAQLKVRCELNSPAQTDADRVQIERMVSNLLSNAVKYTPSGGTVVARVHSPGDKVIFEVEDSGVGIGADHLPHIFDRFYRVPGSSKEKQGLGLGLSFVAWIVKAHDGVVEVSSKPGDGTRFTIALPAAAVHQAESQTPAEAAVPQEYQRSATASVNHD